METVRSLAFGARRVVVRDDNVANIHALAAFPNAVEEMVYNLERSDVRRPQWPAGGFPRLRKIVVEGSPGEWEKDFPGIALDLGRCKALEELVLKGFPFDAEGTMCAALGPILKKKGLRRLTIKCSVARGDGAVMKMLEKVSLESLALHCKAGADDFIVAVSKAMGKPRFRTETLSITSTDEQVTRQLHTALVLPGVKHLFMHGFSVEAGGLDALRSALRRSKLETLSLNELGFLGYGTKLFADIALGVSGMDTLRCFSMDDVRAAADTDAYVALFDNLRGKRLAFLSVQSGKLTRDKLRGIAEVIGRCTGLVGVDARTTGIMMDVRRSDWDSFARTAAKSHSILACDVGPMVDKGDYIANVVQRTRDAARIRAETRDEVGAFAEMNLE